MISVRSIYKSPLCNIIASSPTPQPRSCELLNIMFSPPSYRPQRNLSVVLITPAATSPRRVSQSSRANPKSSEASEYPKFKRAPDQLVLSSPEEVKKAVSRAPQAAQTGPHHGRWRSPGEYRRHRPTHLDAGCHLRRRTPQIS
jgi:hypothetical protein